MLGLVDDELIETMGIDVVGAWGKNNMFGIFNHEPFKEYQTNWGQTVLVPEGFNTNLEEFGLVTEADLQFWKDSAQKARATGKAVIAGLGGCCPWRHCPGAGHAA